MNFAILFFAGPLSMSLIALTLIVYFLIERKSSNRAKSPSVKGSLES